MRGTGVPIGERAAASSADSTRIHLSLSDRPDTSGHATKRTEQTGLPLHCWVHHQDTAAAPWEAPDRTPGLLMQWQHDGARWWGLVMMAVYDHGQPVVYQRLVPSERLSPVVT